MRYCRVSPDGFRPPGTGKLVGIRDRPPEEKIVEGGYSGGGRT